MCSQMDMCFCHILKLNINEFEIISQTYISYTHYGQLRAHHLYVIKNCLGFIVYFKLLSYINGTLANQHKEKDRILNRKMGKHCGQAITKEEIQLAKQ